jgi:hypothetical protein
VEAWSVEPGLASDAMAVRHVTRRTAMAKQQRTPDSIMAADTAGAKILWFGVGIFAPHTLR